MSTIASPTPRSIAKAIADYLRTHAGVCAEGNANGIRWLRYHDDEWQAVTYSTSSDRSREYVEGEVYTEEKAIEWLTSKPATLMPQSDAGSRLSTDDSVWDDVARQAVFGDTARCFYCGDSEEAATLTTYQTVEDGECSLCEECAGLWKDAGEIVDTVAA